MTDDDWRIDACPEHGGALAIGSDGRYHMTWFTQGKKRQGLFYASSADRGKTWSAPVRIGTEAALAGHADVLAINGQVFLAWQQFDGTRTSILAMTSGDNGSAGRRRGSSRQPLGRRTTRDCSPMARPPSSPGPLARMAIACCRWQDNRLKDFVPGSAAS